MSFSLIYSVDSGAGTSSVTGYTGNTTDPLTIDDTYGGFPVTSISNNALAGCTMNSITIGANISSIGSYAFSSCSSLSSITFNNSSVPNFFISDYAFFYCTSFTSFTVPSNVIVISNNTFEYCLSLQTITIPDSVTSIGNDAFFGCTSLNNINFSGTPTLQSIGSEAFLDCYSLHNFTIPASVTNIAVNAFQNCTSLTSLNVENGNTSFTSQDGILYNYNLTTLVAYPLASSSTSYTISPSTVTTIGAYAFYGSTNITSITISSAITNIGDFAFSACTSLTSFTVEVGNTSFTSQDGILYNSDLTTLVAYPLGNTNISYTISPSSVTTIGNTAFSGTVSNNNYLQNITFSPNVTIIGDNAFANSNNLLTVTFLEKNATPTLGNNAFYNSNGIQLNAYYLQGADPTSLGPIPPLYNPNFLNIYEIRTPCFKEGTQILTDKGYRNVEDLKNGDLVKTFKNGYVPIYMIGKGEIYNSDNKERIKERLYLCSKNTYNDLFEDLVITGCHSILVDKFKNQKERLKVIEVNGDTFVTDCKYRLPACADENTETYPSEGIFTIYHLALENQDYYMNYGIYANGLLVESCSKRFLKELSNLKIIE